LKQKSISEHSTHQTLKQKSISEHSTRQTLKQKSISEHSTHQTLKQKSISEHSTHQILKQKSISEHSTRQTLKQKSISVMVLMLFYWHILGPEHSLNTTDYLSLVAAHVNPFMMSVSSSDRLFQQDNKPCHKDQSSQTGFLNMLYTETDSSHQISIQ